MGTDYFYSKTKNETDPKFLGRWRVRHYEAYIYSWM